MRVANDGGRPRAGRTQVVVMEVGAGLYAVPVGEVVEVLPMVDLLPVPHPPPGLAGLLDFRGTPVPVVDLRRRFGVADAPILLTTPIVVTGPAGAAVGLIADSVLDVVSADRTDSLPIESSPEGPIDGLIRDAGGNRLIHTLAVERIAAWAVRAIGRGGDREPSPEGWGAARDAARAGDRDAGS